MSYKWPFAITCDLENSCINLGKKCDDCKRYWEKRSPRMKYLEDNYEER